MAPHAHCHGRDALRAQWDALLHGRALQPRAGAPQRAARGRKRAAASHHGDANDPRKALGDSHPIEAGSPLHKQPAHRTLGALQDQGVTDEAVSRARSYDHEDSFNPFNTTRPTTTRSRDDWPIARCVLDAPPSSAGFTDTSLQSSEMDTVSVAAAKDVTRAPRPPKAGRFSSGPPSQHSEPAPERKRASQEPPPRGAKGAPCEHSRVLPQVERDPRERA